MKFEKNKEYVVVEGAKAKARQAKESCADGFVPHESGTTPFSPSICHTFHDTI